MIKSKKSIKIVKKKKIKELEEEKKKFNLKEKEEQDKKGVIEINRESKLNNEIVNEGKEIKTKGRKYRGDKIFEKKEMKKMIEKKNEI